MDRSPPVLAPTGDTVSVAAGAEYRISGPLGWLDRWLFGTRHRALWTDTVRVPVLDLRAVGGGLRPRSADSFAGATKLRFVDTSRTDYTFRLTNPRLRSMLPNGHRTDEVVAPLYGVRRPLFRRPR